MRNSYCVKVLRYSVSSIKWGIPAHSATKSSYSIHLQRGNNVAAQTQYLISNPLICVIFFLSIYSYMAVLSLCPRAGFSSGCSVRSSHCGGFSCCRAQASEVAARGLSNCGSQALEHRLCSCGPWGLAATRPVGVTWIRDWTLVFHWQADPLPGKPSSVILKWTIQSPFTSFELLVLPHPILLGDKWSPGGKYYLLSLHRVAETALP